MARAILLLSGGLDSILAGRLLLQLGVEVEAVNFTSPFCRCTPRSMGCSAARRAAEQLGIPVRVFAAGDEYLEMVKRPRFGRGRGMNPCLDCRVLIFGRARRYMEERGADFVATGEVLGERPMSQRLDAMRLIERESGLSDRIVRPLSARLLDPSGPERAGLLDREGLLAIRGRCRQPQISLARQFGIADYPCPAGGCLLTDPEFAERLRDLFEHEPECGLREVRLLSAGRHFRLPSGGKAIVGRNREENETLARERIPGEVLLEPAGMPGPTALCREAETDVAARLVATYTEGGQVIDVSLSASGEGSPRLHPAVRPLARSEIAAWRVGRQLQAGPRRD